MGMSEEEIITSTRELLTSYQTLLQFNSSQNPIFIINHLAKLFDKESGNNISNIHINNNNNNNGVSTDSDIIMQIRAAYKEFKDCADVIRAPTKLVTNLEEILIQRSKEPTTTTTPSTMDTANFQMEKQHNGTESLVQNKNQRKEETILVTTTTVQHINIDSIEQKEKQLNRRRRRNSSVENYYECPYCRGIFFKLEELKAHRNFHRRRSFFPCKFCLRSFSEFRSLKFHEHRCFQKLTVKPNDQLVTREMALAMSKCFHSPLSNNLVSNFDFAKPLPPIHSIPNGTKKRKTCPVNSTPSSSSSSSSAPPPPSQDMLRYIVRVAVNESTGETRKLYKCSFSPDCNKQFSSKTFLFNHLRFHAEEADKQENSNNNNNNNNNKIEETDGHSVSSEDSSSWSSSESDSSTFQGKRKSPRKLQEPKTTNSSASSSSLVFKLKSPLTPANRQRQRVRQKQNEKKTTKRRGRKSHGLGNLVCSVCGQHCLDQGKLTVHMRSHTGERPFSCKHCARGFSTASNCRVHERLHEKKGSFKRRTAASLLESERTI